MAKVVTKRADVLPALAQCFRKHGYEGTSLSLIGKATGLGKGSLYHFFPGGKEDMAAAVLTEIDSWFEVTVFSPLRVAKRPADAIAAMFDAVENYFCSGQRMCLVGAMALGDTRDRFAGQLRGYFERWIEALGNALMRVGYDAEQAASRAQEAVAVVQGAIVLARALDDPSVFIHTLQPLRSRLEKR